MQHRFFFLKKGHFTYLFPCPDHPSEVPEKLIQDRFRKLGRFPEAFSSIHYKGTRTYNPPTDFSGLRRALEQQLENNTTRSPRHPGVIFKALKVSWLLPRVLPIGVPVGGENTQLPVCWCWGLETGAGKRGCRERKHKSVVCTCWVRAHAAKSMSTEDSQVIVRKWQVPCRRKTRLSDNMKKHSFLCGVTQPWWVVLSQLSEQISPSFFFF